MCMSTSPLQSFMFHDYVQDCHAYIYCTLSMCYYTIGQQLVLQLLEANASYRVLAVPLSLLSKLQKKFFVRCQPNVKDHTTFTDFLMKATTEGECIIVEVKFFLGNTI